MFAKLLKVYVNQFCSCGGCSCNQRQ